MAGKSGKNTQYSIWSKVWSTLLIFSMVISCIPGVAVFAAAGDVPEHVKILHDNGDGTYKLALSVTGDATNYKQTNMVDVVIILDESTSMNYGVGTGDQSSSKQPDRNGEYFRYHYMGDNDWYYFRMDSFHEPEAGQTWDAENDPENRSGNNYIIEESVLRGKTRINPPYGGMLETYRNAVRYPSQYRYSATTREVVVRNAIEMLATELLKDGNDVRISVVLFGTDVKASVPWTSDPDTVLAGVDLNASAGQATNWVNALGMGNEILRTARTGSDKFIIFLSDGNPTNSPDFKYSYQGREYNNNLEDNTDLVDRRPRGTTFYSVSSDASAVTNMRTLANNTNHSYSPAKYFDGSNESTLKEAFDSIIEEIVNTLGVTNVEIDDGTTNVVNVSASVDVSLLDIDESSFKYYRSGGDNNQYTPTANTFTGMITKADNTTEEVTQNIGVEWTSANNPSPPAATVEDGHVIWDLSSIGVLENDVTYTVTFDVYPSQTTYDYIAQLKNGTIQYGDLPAIVQQYLTGDNEDGYVLATNTTAKLSYEDSRPGGGSGTITYNNPPTVETTASQMSVSKTWDPQNLAVDLTMTVTRDGLDYYDIELTEANNYSGRAFISTGLIRQTVDGTGKITGVQILDHGHDYGFSEMDDNSYYWDLTAETVRPMLINSASEISTLVLITEEETVSSISSAMGANIFLQQDGETYYKIDGNYYRLSSSGDVGNLNASNTKRGNLTLNKVVTGDDPGTGVFNFTLEIDGNFNEHITTVVASGDPDTYTYVNKDGRTVTITKDIVHNNYVAIDKYQDGSSETTIVLYGDIDADALTFTYEEALWFSMRDIAAGVNQKGLEIAGWTEETNSVTGETTGYYYAPNGTPLTVDITENNNIRFSNIPLGSTYIITENSMSQHFQYVSADVKIGPSGSAVTDENAVVTDSSRKVEGTVSESNKAFNVTFTNEYVLTSAVITKTFVGITQDQIPDDYAIVATVGEGSRAENVTLKTTDSDVEVSDDGLTYTWTISDLPENTTVSVAESNAEVAGYHLDSTISPAQITTNKQSEDNTITLTNKYAQLTNVVNKPALTVRKIDQDGNIIPNVAFRLTDSSNREVWSGVTDSEGKFIIDFDDLEIEFGTNPQATFNYTLTETAPAGYTGAGPWTVTISEDNGVVVERLNETNNLYEKIYDWVIDTIYPETGYSAANSTLTVRNTLHKHNITVTKTFEGIPSSLIPAAYGIEIKYNDSQTVNATLTKANATASSDGLTLTWTLENVAFGTKISYEEKDYQVMGYEWSSESSSSVTGEVTVSDAANTHAISLTNKYSIKSYDVTVIKEFQGITDSSLIPEGFKVTADVNGTVQDLTVSGKTPASTENGLKYTWTIENVPFGSEIAFDESGTAIDGYTLGTVTWSDSSKKLTVSADETANQFTIVNPYTLDTGKLIITKALSDDSAEVEIPANTRFTVTGPQYPTGHVFTYSEFTDGSLVLDNIRTGDYTVTESADSAKIQGYDLTVTYDPASGSATVSKNGEATVAVTNKYVKKTDTATVHGTVTVTKIDQDNQPLDGASFALKDGNKVVLTFTAGTATIITSDPALASYLPSTDGGTTTLKLMETEAPTGYQKDETEYDVVLGTSIREELINDVFVTTTTYSIKIIVNSAENTSISVKNTKITENETVHDSITVSKVDQTGVALSGAKFTLYDGETSLAVYDSQSFTISTADAALAGKLPDSGSSVQLALRETTTPQGYTGDTTDHAVVISASSEEALTEGVYVTTKTYTITIDGAETKNIVNIKKTGTDTVHNQITITKTDGTNQIAGATFEIRSGETLVKEFSAGEYTISTSDDYLATYLPAVGGTTTLTLIETHQPEGYELDETPHTITIGASASEAYDSEQDMFITTTTYTISADLSSIPNAKITGSNTIHGSATVKKVDESGAALTGAVFTLYSGETPIATYQAGTATISTSDSALATYLPAVSKTTELTLKETQAPAGYDGDTQSHTVLISAAESEALTDGVFVTTKTYSVTIDGEDEVSIENTKRTGTARVDSEIIVNKVDGEGTALSGASFAITTVGDEPATVKTFTAGTAVISTEDEAFAEYLPTAGNSVSFILKETAAPDGYRMDGSEYSVTISASQNESLDQTENKWITTTTYTIKVANETEKTITNTKITGSDRVDTAVEITKVDSVNNASALEGARFILKTVDGTAVNTYTTGRDGKIVISTDSDALADYLPTVNNPRTFLLEEEKAPEGYNAGSERHTVTITASEEEELTNHVFVTTTTYLIAVDGQSQSAKITNVKITDEARVDTEITVTKVNEDGETINGATFALTSADGETEIAQFTGGSFKISTADEILVDYLPSPGEVPVELILKETAAPTGYVADGDEHVITISADSEEELDLSRGESGVFVTTTTYTILVDEEDSIAVTNRMVFGDLQIVKDLTSYEVSGSVSFVFSVTATLDDKVVFDDVYGLTFDKAGSKSIFILDEIPVGAKVVVQEIYSGAGYKVTSDARIETTIVPRDTADSESPGMTMVVFNNEYGDQLKQGFGIVNKFEYSEGGWTYDNEGDNEAVKVPVEPVEPRIQ